MLKFTTDAPAYLQAHFVFSSKHSVITEKDIKNLQAIALDNTYHLTSLIRHNNGLIEVLTDNTTYSKGGVLCSKDSFFVNQTLVFQIKFCGKSPDLRVAANRYSTNLNLPPTAQSQ